MQVHARDKPIPREGDSAYSEDALLQRTAQLTIGYSGAELANLLNEAAILMVISARFPGFHLLTNSDSFDAANQFEPVRELRKFVNE